MLQLNLIGKDTFVNFFAQNAIPWQGEKPIEGREAMMLLRAALHISPAFHSFVKTTLLSEDFARVQTNFENSEEAYEMFKHFLIGFTNRSVNN